MNTTTVSPLVLEAARGQMAKISSNVLHKDPNLTIFTMPVEGIALVEEQLDAFLGKYTFRSWYEQRKDGSWHPMGWWEHRKDGDFPIDEEFHTDSLTLEFSGELTMDFETEEAEDEKNDDVPAAKITSIKLKPTPGGVTLLSFHLQVRPGLGKDNLLLQEHQYRPVTITIGETTVAPKKGKQQQLALEPPKPAAPPAIDVQTATGADLDKLAGLTERPEGLTDEQVRELAIARIAGASQAGDGPTSESDAYLDGIMGRPPAIESRGGDAIDAELHARHPEGSGEVMGADAHPDETNTEVSAENGMDADLAADLQRFEDSARASLENFSSVSERGVIDGRSERVKHQDAQKGEEAA